MKKFEQIVRSFAVAMLCSVGIAWAAQPDDGNLSPSIDSFKKTLNELGSPVHKMRLSAQPGDGPSSIGQVLWSGTWAAGSAAGLSVCLWGLYIETVRNVNRKAFDKQDNRDIFQEKEIRLTKAKPLVTVKPISRSAWFAMIVGAIYMSQRALWDAEEFYETCQRHPRCKKIVDAFFARLEELHGRWRGE